MTPTPGAQGHDWQPPEPTPEQLKARERKTEIPADAESCADPACLWHHSWHFHVGTKVIAPGQMIW